MCNYGLTLAFHFRWFKSLKWWSRVEVISLSYTWKYPEQRFYCCCYQITCCSFWTWSQPEKKTASWQRSRAVCCDLYSRFSGITAELLTSCWRIEPASRLTHNDLCDAVTPSCWQLQDIQLINAQTAMCQLKDPKKRGAGCERGCDVGFFQKYPSNWLCRCFIRGRKCGRRVGQTSRLQTPERNPGSKRKRFASRKTAGQPRATRGRSSAEVHLTVSALCLLVVAPLLWLSCAVWSTSGRTAQTY